MEVKEEPRKSDDVIEMIHLKAPITCAKGGHVFDRQGQNAKCRKCPVGYPLGVGMDVVDGHIYAGNELVL